LDATFGTPQGGFYRYGNNWLSVHHLRIGVVVVMGSEAKLLGSSGRRRAWMDAEAAAEALGTTAHTMRRLARDGRSPAIV
jgi:hypothetical protein